MTMNPQAHPTPLLSCADTVAMLFGHSQPYEVVGARVGNRMDPPRDQSQIMRSVREKMLERRAEIINTLETGGDATTGDLAVWVDSNPDAVLKDLRALEASGKVECRKEVRYGHEALVWSRSESVK